jgi:uroporphyrinogen-III synthase
MRVLVTRPEEDARETAARLVSVGHEPIVVPLIAIHFLDGPEVDLKGAQAVIATSSNGVRALSRRTKRRDLPLFAVGRQTAETARAQGFANVTSADGDADALANLISSSLAANKGALLHATGKEASGALVAGLKRKGYDVRYEVLYETPGVASLPTTAATALRGNAIDAVLLFSQRTARIFRERVTDAGLAARCAGVLAVCISKSAAGALAPLNFQEIRIAAEPNQDALLARLG